MTPLPSTSLYHCHWPQRKAEPLGFIFSQHFSTDQDEIGYGVEAVQLEHPDTIFWARFSETRETTAALLTASKNSDAGMHLNESMWFKVGMLIDAIELYF